MPRPSRYVAPKVNEKGARVSEQDSFIAEVNDAVREDQLYGYVRKYGWIAALVIVALVGATAWNAYTDSQAEAGAKALGDNLLAAVEQNDPEARALALAEVAAEGPAAAVTSLMTAAAKLEAGDTGTALSTLEALSTNQDVGPVYRDIALFKAALIDEGQGQLDKLNALAQPGSSLRLMAQEQLALLQIENGETDAAVEAFRAIIADAEVTQGLRERAQTLIVALGAPLEEEEAAADQ